MIDLRSDVEELRRKLNEAAKRIADLEQRPRETEARLRRHNAVLTDLSRSDEIRRGDLDSCLRLATETAARTLEVERVSVWLFNDDRSRLICEDLFERSHGRHSSGQELEAAAYPRYFAALEHGRSIAAGDARSNPDTSEFRDSYLEPLRIQSMLDAPIREGGDLLGVLCHEHTESPRCWSAEETQFAASVADFVSLAHEFAREHRTRQLERGKSETLRLLATGHPLDGILDSLARTMEKQITDLWCSVLLLDDEKTLRKCAAPSLPQSYTEAIDGLKIGPSSGVCGTASFRGERVIVADVADDPLCAEFKDLFLGHGLRSCWSQPILSSTGVVLGAFAMYSSTVRVPSAYELEMIESAAYLAGIAIEKRRDDEQMRRLNLALEHAMSGIVRFNSEGRFASINDSGADLFGYRAEEMIGRHWSDAVEQADHGPFGAARERVASEGRIETEFRAIRRDGSSFHCRALIVRPGLEPDSAAGQICFLQDITASTNADKERRLLQEQLRHSQKMEAIGQLAGGVAHDFNNLLTAILGNTEMLLDSLRDPSDSADSGTRESALEEIQRAGERAAELTRQLLAFGRKQVRKVRSIDPNAVVTEAQGMLSRLIGETIEVETRLTPGVPRIRADLSQLNQVLINLAVNARDAMPSGGRLTLETESIPSGGIELGPAPAGPAVMIKVSDNGIGMDAETQKRIFEPFFTTKPLGRGTGLGLATVYGIVAQSGGRIFVDSEAGRGTTFKVVFPAVEDDELEALEDERTDAAQPTDREETVLLCEDDELVRSVSETALRSAGYRVLSAALPEEAITLFRSHRDEVDMLLTDTVMPGMNGPGLAKELLSDKPGLKVLFVSGYTSGAVEAEDFGGETEFLQKPYNITTLLSRVRNMLEA